MKSENQLELIQVEALSFPDQAKEIIITDEKTLQRANEFLQVCKKLRNKIHAYMDPIKDATYKAWKGSLIQIERLEKPLIAAEGMVKPQVAAYRRKIEEAIRQKEEEARAKIEEERRKQEELLKQSAALESAGDHGRADEKFEKAEAIDEEVKESIQKIAEISHAPKLAGTTIRRIPKWKLINLSEVPREYLKLDEVKIGTAVRASKATIKIPGIEVYLEDSVATRG